MERVENVSSEIEKIFDNIENKGSDTKGILSLFFIKNHKNNEVNISLITKGNKIDIILVLISLLKEEQKLDIQEIFEAVKDSI